MKTINERVEIAIELRKLLEKYIYLTDKIQHEVVHADTNMLFRDTEARVRKQLNLLKEALKR